MFSRRHGKLPQPLLEGVEEMRGGRWGGRKQHTDLRDLGGLLGVNGERRKRETECENEPDQPHSTSVEDGCREV